MQIGPYFIMAIFSPNFVPGRENTAEEFMPSELFDMLEEVAQREYNEKLWLHDMQVEWDMDRLFIDVGASIPEPDDTDEQFVTLRFHTNKSGELSKITLSR